MMPPMVWPTLDRDDAFDATIEQSLPSHSIGGKALQVRALTSSLGQTQDLGDAESSDTPMADGTRYGEYAMRNACDVGMPVAEPDQDAALIDLCDRLTALAGELEGLAKSDPSALDGGPNKGRHDALWRERVELRGRIYELADPVTRAGAEAAARAAMAVWDRDVNGNPTCKGLADRLAVMALKSIASGPAEA
jgi:hypothetical protein